MPLRDPFEGLWRARCGESGFVRYRINEANHHIVVLDVDLRLVAYRH
jgi:mRNA-degrading endonuclease RelE of RelBE toxin-antitoxin system